MRFADIVIDLASVVKASRSVASKHIELRAQQLDRYGQTSSIVRSLRQQGGEQGQHVQQASRSTPTETPTTPPVRPEGDGPEKPDETRQENQKSTPSVNSADNLRGHTGPSLEEQQHAHRNLFRSDHPRGSVVLQSDQGAILNKLRRSAAVAAQQENAQPSSRPVSPGNTGAPPKVPDDIPPDVDVNVFHTNRGSHILGKQREGMIKGRPHLPPPTPSWFKDFGHGKTEPKQEDGHITSTGGESLNIKSQPPAENISPPAEAVEESRNNNVEPTRAETEHTQMVDEILSRAEQETPVQSEPSPTSLHVTEPTTSTYTLRESRVPATRLSRLWNYGGLAAGMLGGAISESVSRGFGGGGRGSVLLSAGNMERLVTKLSRMRGAALKMGQMMSFQDAKMLPAPLQEVLQRVQDRADYMPSWQRDRMLTTSLGPEWRGLFDEFEETPIAAASIGQVHRATLKSTGEKVAVKIQFPGVADSINSDLDNLSMLLTASKMLPKGLYLNKTIDNARTELGWECDYEREADCGKRYRELLADEPDVFVVPNIYTEASGKHVLTMEFMEGTGVTRVKSFTQEQRDWIGTQILRLCLREITEFRFMQTDPNWTNFLYNAATNKLELLDFGASREYPEEFVSQYVSLLAAASRTDRRAIKDLSESLGYLTGHESRTMLDAHVASILTLAEPFFASAVEEYDFRDQTITERVKALIPVMIRERLAPPPEETYSLHRKLSGAFLLCARLGSRVRCRELFEQALRKAGKTGEL
ncbi:hypothetical protein DL763_008480 [Monosporascus cannonballus]|nr:hypothetical protein DL763_008480 [Monosporascus cannonballus]